MSYLVSILALSFRGYCFLILFARAFYSPEIVIPLRVFFVLAILYFLQIFCPQACPAAFIKILYCAFKLNDFGCVKGIDLGIM